MQWNEIEESEIARERLSRPVATMISTQHHDQHHASSSLITNYFLERLPYLYTSKWSRSTATIETNNIPSHATLDLTKDGCSHGHLASQRDNHAQACQLGPALARPANRHLLLSAWCNDMSYLRCIFSNSHVEVMTNLRNIVHCIISLSQHYWYASCQKHAADNSSTLPDLNNIYSNKKAGSL